MRPAARAWRPTSAVSVDKETEPEGDGEYNTEHLLTDSVAEAVRAGLAELTRLDAVVTQAKRRFEAARDELTPRGLFGTRGEDGFSKVLDGVVTDLMEGLAESRRGASTFNIAFFGRTGAGKSTLLSALGVPGQDVGCRRLIGGLPPSAEWRRPVL